MISRRLARSCVIVVGALGLTVGCGDSSPSGSTTTPTTTTPTTPALEQPAIWPAVDVQFASPELAAEDFVTNALDVPVSLGAFQAGDARSGEIALQFMGEGGSGPPIVRSTLLLRQLGSTGSWYLIGAANDNASITVPAAGATVPAGPVTVRGTARGFEGAVNVTAFVAGDAGTELDTALAMGGSLATPKPYTVTLDLSAAHPGDTVVILVRGGVGLETDPGEVGAIPVVIAP